MMKLYKHKYGIALGTLALTFASCYNADREFPDFEDGTTAYFAYQDPVRTVVLGNDIYDNSLDNQHKIQIWATMGGAYSGRNAVAQVTVDNSLCDNLYFIDEGGNPANPVLPMPADYFKLASNSISYGGDVRGNVEVQLTDAFFNDEKSTQNTYVIPLVMTSVSGIDHILSGKPREGLTPSRTNTEDWDVVAKDYVLYCVKYKNPWHAKYIRRGVDMITEDGNMEQNVRKDFSFVNSDPTRYTENPVNANDEVCGITTKNMNTSIFPVSIKRYTKDKEGKQNAAITCNLILTFDGNKCNITTDDADTEVSGSGEFIANGTELRAYKDYQWGSMNGKPVQRDILRLSYNINFKQGKFLYTKKDEKTGKDIDVFLDKDVSAASSDTLVVQTREANIQQFFTPKYVK